MISTSTSLSSTPSPSSSLSSSSNNITNSGDCKRCHCKNSKCLKMYCECFANKILCNNCQCFGCQNNEANIERVERARALTLERNPDAFNPKIKLSNQKVGTNDQSIQLVIDKHSRGCHCRKSGCLKKYCECFQAGIPCNENCKCYDCKNQSHNHSNNNHSINNNINIDSNNNKIIQEKKSKRQQQQQQQQHQQHQQQQYQIIPNDPLNTNSIDTLQLQQHLQLNQQLILQQQLQLQQQQNPFVNNNNNNNINHVNITNSNKKQKINNSNEIVMQQDNSNNDNNDGKEDDGDEDYTLRNKNLLKIFKSELKTKSFSSKINSSLLNDKIKDLCIEFLNIAKENINQDESGTGIVDKRELDSNSLDKISSLRCEEESLNDIQINNNRDKQNNNSNNNINNNNNNKNIDNNQSSNNFVNNQFDINYIKKEKLILQSFSNFLNDIIK